MESGNRNGILEGRIEGAYPLERVWRSWSDVPRMQPGPSPQNPNLNYRFKMLDHVFSATGWIPHLDFVMVVHAKSGVSYIGRS